MRAYLNVNRPIYIYKLYGCFEYKRELDISIHQQSNPSSPNLSNRICYITGMVFKRF